MHFQGALAILVIILGAILRSFIFSATRTLLGSKIAQPKLTYVKKECEMASSKMTSEMDEKQESRLSEPVVQREYKDIESGKRESVLKRLAVKNRKVASVPVKKEIKIDFERRESWEALLNVLAKSVPVEYIDVPDSLKADNSPLESNNLNEKFSSDEIVSDKECLKYFQARGPTY
ncbi:hypothetical protein ROZALSC1DRAFT_28149 [Rozella allomycis CSF55]|uniref:Uncharacterized protein n=1 Tax=Rozella allomycis (strain CSF55) TaxID=988480 RepID=A0A075AU30_ROZAC|nr:hypothetical protein O9G_000415 [Rozella allomycis CSF55]RKP20345.1 hypothetical protein ROZALSC1DRAFT_28149 [Rozella allomycis CSF55]|eukprot:EPZ33640.1 hypothetical protein O9G_000415 [Rozella allomycis CSF55]